MIGQNVQMDASSAPTVDATGGDHLLGLADEIAEGMLACTLPKPRWTHEAHVLACVSLVRCVGATDALATLRVAIPRYNESTGVANTDTDGYHDTLTVYYVWAVDQLLTADNDTTAVLHSPLVDRHAALLWWPNETLFSVQARRAFVAPTLTNPGVRIPSEPV